MRADAVAGVSTQSGVLTVPEGRFTTRSEGVEELLQPRGVAAATRTFIATAGVAFDDRDPDVEIPTPTPERIANLEFFLANDDPAVCRYRPDSSALQAVGRQMVPGLGQSSEGFPRQAAEALADKLGEAATEFSGFHSGFDRRSRGLAIGLLAIRIERAAGAEPAAKVMAS